MTDPLTTELIVQIRAEMRRQGLTYEALADRIGVHVSTLKSRMSARHGLRVAHLTEIAEALGLTEVELTTRARQVVAA